MEPHRFVESLSFDREIPLDELIGAADRKALKVILSQILRDDFAIIGPAGETLLGEDNCQENSRVSLVLELEPLGYLISECEDKEALQIAQKCIVMQLRFAQKYLMASALHIEAIQEDYTKLCEEHEALLESEAKYKQLSESLDEKVKEQVQTIESAQRQLFESEKLASVGHLAASVAHEINNPIGFINSNLNTAKGYVEDFKALGAKITNGASPDVLKAEWQELDMDFVMEDFEGLLVECLDGGKRVAEIVADLKLFSNIDAEDEITVDLNKYVATSMNVAQASVDGHMEIDFQQGDLPMVECRPGYIGQVILALVLNANDAMAGKGTIHVRTYLKDAYAFVELRDEGPGIPREVIDKVFDPFFTTKEVGAGKGLGLTSCRDIVLNHGGDIRIISEPGQGTTVSFWIPVKSNAKDKPV